MNTWRHAAMKSGAALATAFAVGSGKQHGVGMAVVPKPRPISAQELRQHCGSKIVWISFHGTVYDITEIADSFLDGFKSKQTSAKLLAERVAGRHLEHFLGREVFGAFGHTQQSCGPDANCCSRDVRKVIEKLLEPHRIGVLQAEPPSRAAQAWPDVDPSMIELRIETAGGRHVRTLSVAQIRKYSRTVKTVTHKCTSTGNETTKEWVGVRVRDLLQACDNKYEAYPDYLVTFVGMDGYGYSLFHARAVLDDVLVAYECGGVPLDTEGGGPLRLVKDGQHAKWVEKVILE